MAQDTHSEETIFLAALEKSTAQERASYIAGACAGNPEMLERLQKLLQSHEESQGPLDAPPPGLGDTIDRTPREPEGSTIGPYKLLQEIGEGGFGLVYMAEQQEPVKRKVALKIIKPGMDSREVIARFEAERQALAMMDHPNIARVFDAGTTDSGRPYFVMELVKGISLTDYCDKNKLSTRDRLVLFSTICRAVQHAHQKGVIHRDIKPSNIMVTLHDGQPVPKVIDFGVSKALNQQLTEKTLFTRYGQMIGTPQYMSPEQAEMSGLDIDTRSDIYSLGVLLYEMLTGCPPFDAERLREAAYAEMCRVICEEDPLRPSNIVQTLEKETATSVASHRSSKPDALCKLLRGDLDWIVMKSLEKDRNRRYDTATALADDVARHLNDEPVLAGPPRMAYRFRKAFRRNRAAFISSGVVVIAICLGLISSLAGLKWAMLERDIAVRAQRREHEAKAELTNQRDIALRQSEAARRAANDAGETLGLLLNVLAKATVNPNTARAYTVQEALDDLATNLATKRGINHHTVAVLNYALGLAYLNDGQPINASKHLTSVVATHGSQATKLQEKQRFAARLLVFLHGSEVEIATELDAHDHEEYPDARPQQLNNVARARMEDGDLAEAEALLNESASRLGDPQSLDDIPQILLARLYKLQQKEPQCVDMEEKAVALAAGLNLKTFKQWLDQVVYWAAKDRPLLADFALRAAFNVPIGAHTLAMAAASTSHRLRNAGFMDLAERCEVESARLLATSKPLTTPPKKEYIWRSHMRGRMRARLGDYVGAARLFREALDYAIANPEITDWSKLCFRHELGLAYKHLGRDDDAEEQLSAVADKLQRGLLDGKFVYDPDLDLALYLHCVTNTSFDCHSELTDRVNDLAARDGKKSIHVLLALSDFLRENDRAKAKELLKQCACRDGLKSTSYLTNYAVHSLVDMHLEDRELKAAIEFLQQVIEVRDSVLPYRHPDRAYPRVMLAKLLLENSAHTKSTAAFALEAHHILSSHEMTPEAILQEIDGLLKQLQVP